MSVFSTPAFLETLAELYYPGREAAVEVCRVDGLALRLLVLDGHEVVTAAPYYDFPLPLETPWLGAARPVRYVPRTVLRTTTVEERPPTGPGQHASPYVEWGRFADHAAFEAMVGRRIGNLLPDSRRRRHKLERDLGPLRFTFDDARPEVFDACVRWKSAQYRETGVPDLFARPQNVELFRRLRGRGVAVLSSLYAGDRLVAAHLGGLAEGRHAWWVPAYDPGLARYSPGRLMLHELLRESHALGHREFDFLIGDEAYKFHYATHSRLIGPLGTPPLRDRVLGALRARTRSALEGHPALLGAAKSVKRHLFS